MKPLTKLSDNIRLAIGNLWVHKVQSSLTALGIIFGVWGVVAMLAINEGASAAASQALRRLGTDNILIQSVKPPVENMEASDSSEGTEKYGLTHVDVERLVDNIPRVRQHVVTHQTTKRIHKSGKNHQVTVIASSPLYAELARVSIVRGRFITHSDNAIFPQSKAVIVLTGPLIREIFTYRDPIGQTVRLNGQPFTVVGVMEPLPDSITGQNVDASRCAVIPWQTAMNMFGPVSVPPGGDDDQAERVEVSQLIMQMADEQAVLAGQEVAENLLARFHDRPDYTVRVPLAQIRAMAEQRRFWNITLFGIAAISLVVGGIGIMNIMLASVTERTREIGIRRALGARRGDIVLQFLVEAVALTTLGGLVGIALGKAAPSLIEDFMDFRPVVANWTLLLPFAMAILVGLISGLYPAMRAARLDPITALRHE
ncbi:MAG: ABC transporter permease [Phycisphaerae bacterium]